MKCIWVMEDSKESRLFFDSVDFLKVFSLEKAKGVYNNATKS